MASRATLKGDGESTACTLFVYEPAIEPGIPADRCTWISNGRTPTPEEIEAIASRHEVRFA